MPRRESGSGRHAARGLARCSSLAVAAVVLLGGVVPEPDVEPDLREVLTGRLGFTTADLRDLQLGRVVRHSIETEGSGEIVVAGAVRVDAAKSLFVERVRDIVRFKRGPGVLQIGRFGDPPTAEDLAGLSVGLEDFDVRTCRIADCGIRLPASLIRQFQREIDITAPDAQAQAAVLFKRALIDHVLAYRSGGTGLMLQYDDGDRPIRPVDEFNGILSTSPFLGLLPPGLAGHLRDFAATRTPGAEDFLYWSKEQFGVGPFISVTHVTLTCRSAHACLMITRDVYSSRYVDASLAVAIASDSLSWPGAFYLVYANQSRANALKGRLSGVRKAIASRRARRSLEESLAAAKRRLEER